MSESATAPGFRGILTDVEVLREGDASLPDGLDTHLESGGGGLSAGESQLVAFARILLLQDPSLVILDEASSSIDPATERLLNASVKRLVAGRTAIVIAHRLSTVSLADRIMIVDGGRIVEYGARTELQEKPDSLFRTLLATNLEMKREIHGFRSEEA